MDLWTEYEGKTIADGYYLESLLRSEGRSAFFRVRGAEGERPVMRLKEAHFDQEEMLKRWRQIATVDQENLIAIRHVGRATVDGVALTYAVLEPSDANLADVLKERPLTTDETLDVARAVVRALAKLHGNGLVHEHIEPANVLAVGETVKLRSDCVRECVVDQEFSTEQDCQRCMRSDIQSVGVLLLQCLTLNKEWHPDIALPLPFRQIIPGALNGSMSLQQIASALDAPAPATAVLAGLDAQTPPPPAPGSGLRQQEQLSSNAAPADAPVQAALLGARHHDGVSQNVRSSISSWIVYAAGVALLALVSWYFLGRSSKPPASTRAADSAPATVSASPLTPRAAVQRSAAPSATASGPRWHVIAYTYNHENQAVAKVKELRKNHLSLDPEVFSSSGGGPYYVALGGSMTRQQAEELLRRARNSGLPRDTFMRNY